MNVGPQKSDRWQLQADFFFVALEVFRPILVFIDQKQQQQEESLSIRSSILLLESLGIHKGS